MFGLNTNISKVWPPLFCPYFEKIQNIQKVGKLVIENNLLLLFTGNFLCRNEVKSMCITSVLSGFV